MSKSDGSVRLSPKYGINPSMVKCFWCGEVKGIRLLGRLPGDKEAPRTIMTGYDPCDACQKKWEQGVVFLELEPIKGKAVPGIPPGHIPTGSYWIVDREIVATNYPELNLEHGVVFITVENAHLIGFYDDEETKH